MLGALPSRETWQPCELEQHVKGKSCSQLAVTPEISPFLTTLSSSTGATFADWTHIPVVRLAPGSAATTAHTDCMGVDAEGRQLVHDISVVVYLTSGAPVRFPGANISVEAKPGRLVSFDPHAVHYTEAGPRGAGERLAIQIPLARRHAERGPVAAAFAQPFMMSKEIFTVAGLMWALTLAGSSSPNSYRLGAPDGNSTAPVPFTFEFGEAKFLENTDVTLSAIDKVLQESLGGQHMIVYGIDYGYDILKAQKDKKRLAGAQLEQGVGAEVRVETEDEELAAGLTGALKRLLPKIEEAFDACMAKNGRRLLFGQAAQRLGAGVC